MALISFFRVCFQARIAIQSVNKIYVIWRSKRNGRLAVAIDFLPNTVFEKNRGDKATWWRLEGIEHSTTKH